MNRSFSLFSFFARIASIILINNFPKPRCVLIEFRRFSWHGIFIKHGRYRCSRRDCAYYSCIWNTPEFPGFFKSWEVDNKSKARLTHAPFSLLVTIPRAEYRLNLARLIPEGSLKLLIDVIAFWFYPIASSLWLDISIKKTISLPLEIQQVLRVWSSPHPLSLNPTSFLIVAISASSSRLSIVTLNVTGKKNEGKKELTNPIFYVHRDPYVSSTLQIR